MPRSVIQPQTVYGEITWQSSHRSQHWLLLYMQFFVPSPKLFLNHLYACWCNVCLFSAMCMFACLHAAQGSARHQGESKQEHLQPCHHLSLHFLLQSGGIGARGVVYGEVSVEDYSGGDTTATTSIAILWYFLVPSPWFLNNLSIHQRNVCIFHACVCMIFCQHFFPRVERGQICKHV